jgi:hypothetical protein
VHNSVTASNVTGEVAVNSDQLSAALRAQASGLHTGPPDARPPRTASAVQPARDPSATKPRLPGWAVLALAIWLGAIAGGLAGVISTW